LSDLLPDKPYFKIGEASKITGVENHVLRYWEKEFSQIRPRRSPSGQRLYRHKDVACFLHIKHLLHERGFTIAGARNVLDGEADAGTEVSLPQKEQRAKNALAPDALVLEIKKVLLELQERLGRKGK